MECTMKKQKPYFVPLCLSVLVAEIQSIQTTKLCKTNPISKMPKMNITSVAATTNNYEPRTTNSKKQTQTKPNLPTCVVGKFALSLSKGLSKRLLPHQFNPRIMFT